MRLALVIPKGELVLAIQAHMIMDKERESQTKLGGTVHYQKDLLKWSTFLDDHIR